MAESFGSLLRGYRDRTKDPRSGGKPLTQDRLLQLLKRQSGLDLSARSVGRWERGEVQFPASQRGLLVSLISILQVYGGIKTIDEANLLLESCGYAVLDDPEAVSIFLSDAEESEESQWMSSTQTAPEKPPLRGKKMDDGDELPAVEQELEDPFGPEQPAGAAVIERHGTQIQVALAPRAWRLPVEALVLPASANGTEVAGGFYQALLDDLDPPVADSLFKLLLDRFPADLAPESPAAIHLPEDLATDVLPFSPSGAATVIIATLRGPDGTLNIQNVDRMMTGLLELAASENLQHFAMPIIGSGATDLAEKSSLADGEKLDVLRVARVMCETLLAKAGLGGIRTVVVATIEPAVVDVARRRFHAFANNLAQALANDEPAQTDLLGIAPEVHALAEALMLREVSAPLAVGIIGGWGSGKSTVMRLMWSHIADLRTLPIEKGWPDEEGTGPEPAFVGHVYQINFNAWTYAKSNLWASLMHEIFIQLNSQLSLEKNLSTKVDLLKGGRLFSHLFDSHPDLDRFLPQIDESLLSVDENLLWDKLRERKKTAIEEVKRTEARIAGLRLRRDQEVMDQEQAILQNLGDQEPQMAVGVLKARVRGFLDQARTDTVAAFLASEDVDEAQVQALFEDLRGIRTTVLLLLQQTRQNPWAALGFSLFCLVVIVGTYGITQWNNWSSPPMIIAQIAAFLPLFVPPVRVARRVSRWLDRQIDEYDRLDAIERERWQDQSEDRLAQLRLQHEKAVEQALATAGPDRDAQMQALADLTEQGNVAAYDRLLVLLEDELKEQRKRAGPTADFISLMEFVEARLDEAYYEKRLGLMHQVQRDLDELSDGLLLWNPQDAEERRLRQELFPRGEPRVILYIDDLDRCPPPRVVEVMEAVQLLLSTPLFVVALGLDTRYITRALEKEYRDILEHEGDPSGMDYIEKIIQIPYRVRPIEPDGLGTFLQAQMEFSEDHLAEITEVSPAVEPSAIEETRQIPVDDTEGTDGSSDAVLKSKPAPVSDLPPEVVRFQRADYDDLVACCRLINLTPRSVKRLVNVLKLVKIFWFRREGRDQARAVKQATIGLLSLSAAYPEIMREVFVRLEAGFRDPSAIDKPTISSYLLAFKPAVIGPDSGDRPPGWQLDRFRADVSGLQKVSIVRGEAPADFLGIAPTEMTLSTFNLIRSFSFVGDFSFLIER